MEYPPFDLYRLLDTVFKPKKGERVAVLIDLKNPEDVKDFRYLEMDGNSIQKMAHEHFYLGLKNGVMEKLGMTGGELFCYKETLGSNLDLEDKAYAQVCQDQLESGAQAAARAADPFAA